MDAILYDGVDPMAMWRAHMREVTMARQAAERRLARRDSSIAHDVGTRAIAARERAAVFGIEKAQINADHQSWQREHGEAVSATPGRRHRKAQEAQR